jgi:hypothetical protein
MVNSTTSTSSITPIKAFPITREIIWALPSITEIYAVNDILLVYSKKTKDPITVSYNPDKLYGRARTLSELKEKMVATGKFDETRLDRFIDVFSDLWWKSDFKRSMARAKDIKTIDLGEVLYN